MAWPGWMIVTGVAIWSIGLTIGRYSLLKKMAWLWLMDLGAGLVICGVIAWRSLK